MTVFCDNYGCLYIDECGFCDCESLSIVDGVCEGSYHSNRNARAERTCKQLRIFNLIKRECDGERYQWHGDEMPNYCPNCGAKVVDE